MDKTLGQHWLVDLATLEEIVQIGQLRKQDLVIEIGPGTGNLTKLLSKAARQVIAIEVDPRLIKGLLDLNLKNVTVIEKSILKVDLNQYQDYKIIANIPYYLTSKLIRQLGQLKTKPTRVVLLVQREIAQRLTAQPGKLSILGLTAQFFWDIELGPIVEPYKFDPAPKVYSQLVILTPRKDKEELQDPEELFRLIRLGYSSKRKTLFNNLKWNKSWSNDQLRHILQSNDIALNIRPQELSLQQWLNLIKYWI